MMRKEKIIVYVMVLILLASWGSSFYPLNGQQNRKRPGSTQEALTEQSKAVLIEAKGNNLLVSIKNKMYTVLTTPYTQVKEKSGEEALLENFQRGDELMVRGNIDKKKYVIVASDIQNTSDRRVILSSHFYGTYEGIVQRVGSKGLSMESMGRGVISVLFNNSLLASEIKEGDRIAVVGLWDKEMGRIGEVKRLTVG